MNTGLDRRSVVMLDVISEHPAGMRAMDWWKEARKRLEKKGLGLSRGVFYRKLNHLMKKYVEKRVAKRNEAVYVLKKNPLKELVDDFQSLMEDLKRYLNTMEEKLKKGEIDKKEAVRYIIEAWNAVSYVIMRTIMLAEEYPEDESAFYEIAGKTIRKIGNILHPFTASDEYEKRFKEMVLEGIVKRKIDEFSPMNRIKKLVEKELGMGRKINIKEAIKAKISAKIERKYN